MSPSPRLEIIPLGGLGEFGMNLMVYRWGTDCLVVDAGLMFPRDELFGVDIVVPDLEFLATCGTLHGVVLTHGHEDHIGAVPYLLTRCDVPIHGTPYALALVRRRLAGYGGSTDAALRPLPPDGELLRLGPFGVEALPVTHSIPQSRLLALHTPVGTVVHSADFKLDGRPPGGERTDTGRLAELGRRGVLALLGDSTNADRPGFTPGERVVVRGLAAQFSRAAGRLVVTTFGSHVQRLQTLVDLAARHGRRVAFVGRSLETHVEEAERLGLLRVPAGLRAAGTALDGLEPRRTLVVASGSQGEPASAMARIAAGRHAEIPLAEGDRVIHAARIIPGNAASIGRMFNDLLRRRIDVVAEADAPVHVSGHASSGELRLLLDLLRPRFLVPIHGEYRQLHAHARLAADHGLPGERIAVIESGEVLALDGSRLERAGRVPAGRVLLDARREAVDRRLVGERRRIAGDGIVIPIVTAGGAAGQLHDAGIVTRGFSPPLDGGSGLIADAQRTLARSLAEATPDERADPTLLRERVRSDLSRFLRLRTRRRPMILPVIVGL